MPRQENQKAKLLHLQQILTDQTDEDHPMTVAELIDALAQREISAERKSIYRDLEQLKRFGVDVQCRRGRSQSPGWFVGARAFELAELKYLVDAVQASRFLTERKSRQLIDKLEGLSSVHQARQLRRQVFVSGRVKTMNESIYYTVDKLHAALSAKRAITFRYFDYDMYRKRSFRHGGRRYHVSPYGLIWSGENYYLVGHDSQSDSLRHYRVDKMSELVVTGLPLTGTEQYPDFDPAVYGSKHFGMFAGAEQTVKLRCAAHMAGVVLDRFGQDIILIPEGGERFTVTLPLVLSPQFFGWLFGLEGEVVLLSPQHAVEEYRQRLAQAIAAHT